MLYFMYTSILCSSEYITPDQKDNFENLLPCLEKCSEGVNKISQGHTADKVFFLTYSDNEKKYLYLDKSMAEKIRASAYLIAEKQIPNFVRPEITSSKKIISPPAWPQGQLPDFTQEL